MQLEEELPWKGQRGAWPPRRGFVEFPPHENLPKITVRTRLPSETADTDPDPDEDAWPYRTVADMIEKAQRQIG